jgi:hypothetical protein
MDKDDGTDDLEQWDDIDSDDGAWPGVLETDETLDDDAVEDPLDVGIAPSDKWSGANRFGTTPEEEREGESLDARLAEEEPDIPLDDGSDDEDKDEDELTRHGYDAEPRAGRLISEDEGLGPDEETDAVAYDAGVDAGGASAEEAAVHLVDDPNDPNGEGDRPLR